MHHIIKIFTNEIKLLHKIESLTNKIEVILIHTILCMETIVLQLKKSASVHRQCFLCNLTQVAIVFNWCFFLLLLFEFYPHIFLPFKITNEFQSVLKYLRQRRLPVLSNINVDPVEQKHVLVVLSCLVAWPNSVVALRGSKMIGFFRIWKMTASIVKSSKKNSTPSKKRSLLRKLNHL